MHEGHSTEKSDKACWDVLTCAEMIQLAVWREVLAALPLYPAPAMLLHYGRRGKHGSLLL